MFSLSFMTVVYVVLFRCFSDVKTAVWISFATGMTIRLDLETLMENSGLVRAIFLNFYVVT